MNRGPHQDFQYGLTEYQFIDSLVKPLISNAKIDSAKYFQKTLKNMNKIEQEELNGLPIFKYCLDFCNSKEFEDILIRKARDTKFSARKN